MGDKFKEAVEEEKDEALETLADSSAALLDGVDYSDLPEPPGGRFSAGINEATRLMGERDQIIAELPESDRRQLAQYQRNASIDERAALTYRRLIDEISPALADKNRQIDVTLSGLPRPEPSGGPSSGDNWISEMQDRPIRVYIDEKGEQHIEVGPDPFAEARKQSEREMTRIAGLYQANESFYAPYGDVAQTGRDNGVFMNFRQGENGEFKPTYYTWQGTEQVPVGVEADQHAAVNFDKLRETKIQDIEQKYGVNVVRGGQEIARPISAGSASLVGSVVIETRHPGITELDSIAKAMELSKATLESGPIDLVFLQNQLLAKEAKSKGEYWREFGRNPTIVLYAPGEMQDGPMQATDFRHTMLHELAHRHQHKSDWSQDVLAPARMGFHNAGGEWILSGKDNQYFKIKEYGSTDWYQCDVDGKPLDKDGKETTPDKAPVFNGHEVRERAAVRPPTSYFANPTEEMAEAMSLFRDGGESRLRLLRESPDLYALAKRRDQLDIDGAFALQEEPGPKLRLPSGEVISRDDKAKQDIESFEAIPNATASINQEMFFALENKLSEINGGTSVGDVQAPKLSPQEKLTKLEGLIKGIDALVVDPARTVKEIKDARAAAERWGLNYMLNPTDSYPEMRAGTYAQYAMALLANGERDKAAAAIKQAETSAVNYLDFTPYNLPSGDVQSFSNLKGVEGVKLNQQSFSSDAVGAIAKMDSVNTVELEGLKCKPEEFAQLKSLPKLQGLILSQVDMAAESLKGLGAMPAMQRLSILDSAGVTDDTMAALEQFPGLAILEVEGTDISDTGLAHLKHSKELIALTLRTEQVISGTGLEHLAECPNLRNLTLSIAGTPSFDGLTKTGVQSLVLATNVSDGAAADLARMPSLTTLDLGESKISAEGIAQVAKSQSLQWLTLATCNEAIMNELKSNSTLHSVTFMPDSGVTEEMLSELRAANPKCTFSLSCGHHY